ncbi:MAG: hypothetical protein HOV80_11180 [Polyangiaceae bacterium]|nr:hypothetical protein [Polyangiaceae bacterium]
MLRPRLGLSVLLVASACLIVRMGGGCHDTCTVTLIEERVVEGAVTYEDEVETLSFDLGSYAVHIVDPIPAEDTFVIDGAATIPWSVPSGAMPQTMRGFVLRLANLGHGLPMRALEPGDARLCSCPETVVSEDDRCGDAAASPATCEDLEGMLFIAALAHNCESGDVCEEDVDLSLEIPKREGKRFSGTVHVRSSQATEETNCSSGSLCSSNFGSNTRF